MPALALLWPRPSGREPDCLELQGSVRAQAGCLPGLSARGLVCAAFCQRVARGICQEGRRIEHSI